MIFAQLTTRESLRDIENSLQAIPDRLYHMGIRSKQIAKSTLADANKNRDYRIFSDFALSLSERARQLYSNDRGFTLDLDNLIYAIDSTTIDLCLSLYPWAKFRKKKAGIKMHTLLDIRGSIPSVIQLSPAVFHDVHFLDVIQFQPGAIYLMDRAYLSFNRLYSIKSAGAYFVIKAKSNLQYKVVERKGTKEEYIVADQIVKLKTQKSQKDYPDQLRRVKFYDNEEKRYVTILTNNFLISANLIGELYRHRWRIELFFKWIKQHLKIKSFFGTTFNAVAIQIWSAICVYLIIAILKKEQKLDLNLNAIAQILSLSLFEKVPLNQLFKIKMDTDKEKGLYKQLKIF